MLIFLVSGEICHKSAGNAKHKLDFEKKDHYYKTVSLTDQSSCNIVKQIAGRWGDQCGFLDGEKYICIDRLYPALQNGTCLVYSFGLADDWDFEIWMASLGKYLAYLEHISTSAILLAYDRLEGPVRIEEDLTIAVKET